MEGDLRTLLPSQDAIVQNIFEATREIIQNDSYVEKWFIQLDCGQYVDDIGGTFKAKINAISVCSYTELLTPNFVQRFRLSVEIFESHGGNPSDAVVFQRAPVFDRGSARG